MFVLTTPQEAQLAPSPPSPALRRRAAAVLRWACLSVALALAGCASGVAKQGNPQRSQAKGAPQRATSPAAPAPAPSRPGNERSAAAAAWAGNDGPGDTHHSELATLPDAEPVVEPISPGGPNRPYKVLGRQFQPQTEDKAHSETGLASWYGRKFHGRRTASGERYDMHAMTAAHPTLPLPSYARVRNPSNGREVIVRINDRGPFHRGRIIDLSYAAASKLGVMAGLASVQVERLTFEEIRTGAWRRGGTPSPAAPPEPAPQPAEAVLAQVQAQPQPQPLPTEPLSAEPTAAGPLAMTAALPATATTATTATTTTTTTVAASEAKGYWVQLGAFRLRDGAEGFQRRVVAELQWLAPVLAVLSEADLHRLHAGPYRSPDEANSVAQRVRAALSLVPVVIERR